MAKTQPAIRNLSRSQLNVPLSMLWRVSSRPIRTRSKPPGFILPCQPALAGKPPSGPGWLHEIKFDGYRVIARKDGKSSPGLGAHYARLLSRLHAHPRRILCLFIPQCPRFGLRLVS
jgi:hypothetical protein